MALCQPAQTKQSRCGRSSLKASRRKARGEIPIELAAQRNHGESFAHAGADELLVIGIENNVEERLRVAVKDRGHVGSRSFCRETERRITTPGGANQPCQLGMYSQ